MSGKAREIYGGLPPQARANYAALKQALQACLEPSGSADYHRAEFASRIRLPNESAREFGTALRRLVVRAYPVVDYATQDMLARDHFVVHVGSGELRIQLRSAKPSTLEDAINLASEITPIRRLEGYSGAPVAQVCGVSGSGWDKDQAKTLLGVVEGLRQEVQALRAEVRALKAGGFLSQSGGSASISPLVVSSEPQVSARGERMVCWECGCDRHLRKDCPYVTGNSRGRAR